MNPLEQLVLKALSKHSEFISAHQVSKSANVDYTSLMSILSKLNEEKKLELRKKETEFAELTPEGIAYAESELPERKLSAALKKGPIPFEDIPKKTGLSPTESQLALQWALKNGWIGIQKTSGKSIIELKSDAKENEEEKLLARLKNKRTPFEKSAAFEKLKKRNLISLITEKEFEVRISPSGRNVLKEPLDDEVNQLTAEMMRGSKWKDVKFREYDLNTILQPSEKPIGRKHFYLQIIRELKEQLVSLGFQEAEGPFTELEFWNMDVLFMPQDHPARDIHDVFQLDLKGGKLPGKKLVNLVKRAHETGVDNSKGWGYEWNEMLSNRIVLRSQTTSVSARTLASGITPPLKMFCIGKVFRPDEIDWKHFIEFNQCEGIVADENMNFRELLGYLKTFAVDIFGAKPNEVKFAPSYFPFTEPSVEMLVKINDKWTEVGGAGIFRTEMTLPLGCDVPVLAWGLGLDRLAMIKLGLKDIRQLFSQDLVFLRR